MSLRTHSEVSSFSLNNYVSHGDQRTVGPAPEARPLGATASNSGGMFRNLPIPRAVARTESVAPQRPAQQALPFHAQTIAQVPPSPFPVADNRRRESNDALERELQEAHRCNLELQKKLKAAATRISVLNHNRTADAQTAEFDVAQLTKRLAKVSETNEQLTSSLNDVRKERAKASEATAVHQKQVNTVQLHMAAAVAERDALRTTVDGLTAKKLELEASNAELESAAGAANAAAPPAQAAPTRSAFGTRDVSASFDLALPPCPVKTSSHAMPSESLGRRANEFDFAALDAVGVTTERGMMEHVVKDFKDEFWRDQMFYRDQVSYGAFYPVAATT